MLWAPLILLWVLFSGSGGPSSNFGLVWNVELVQRDAAGNILYQEKFQNTLTNSGLDAAVGRLSSESVVATVVADTAGDGETFAFDNIVLLHTDDSAAGGIADFNILGFVDGGTGSNSGRTASSQFFNPADGTSTGFGGGDGVGVVTVEFLASSTLDPSTAAQMHLVRVVDDTEGGTATIAEADILATIEISVDLGTTDTLTITWTIDANAS